MGATLITALPPRLVRLTSGPSVLGLVIGAIKVEANMTADPSGGYRSSRSANSHANGFIACARISSTASL